MAGESINDLEYMYYQNVSPTTAGGATVVDNASSSPTGALSAVKVISAASTNATNVKASAGRLYGAQFCNTNAAYRYVKFYNLATAPTVGTSVPVSILGIPPGGRASVSNAQGIGCSAGIAYAITSGMADTDTGAVSANDVAGSILYL